MPEIAVRLQNVVDAQTRLRLHEDELVAARDDFRDALRAAHAAGVPFAVLGRLVGLSRQRVARIVSDG